ncbi:interferon-induced, double-stranded RNA-activated protein kinase-like [Pelodytes ibericus]
MEDQNFKGQLITLCLKMGMKFEFREALATGPSHDPRFTFHAFVNNEKLGEGEHKTKKGAVNIAAKMALETLHAQERSQSPVFASAISVTKQITIIVPKQLATTDFTRHLTGSLHFTCIKYKFEINYVGKFNELCQKKGWMNYSFLEDRRGPPHISEFFCSAVIGERRFPEAKGMNKKNAKRNAAYLALKELKEEHPADIEFPLNATYTQESASGNSPLLNRISNGSSENGSTPLPSTDSKKSFVQTASLTPTGPSSLTPTGPSKPRKVELAPVFPNKDFAKNTLTDDETLSQQYDNITLLGEGGFGTVFKARQKLDKKYYVVKKVKYRSTKSIQEIQVLARLEHQNIVRYNHSWTGKDFFSDTSYSSNEREVKQECLFIQMEWCERGTLKEWIENMKKIDKNSSLNIFQQIIEGIVYIHSQKLIHRDIKPENIFFTSEHKIKIGDFGLVTQMTGEHERQALQRTQGTGTKSYMAPEQYEKHYENEVDIFPLGLILIELFMIFNTRSEKYNEWSKLRNAELPPTFIQQYPAEESIIKLMLSRDPKKRPKADYLKNYFEAKSLFYSKTS